MDTTDHGLYACVMAPSISLVVLGLRGASQQLADQDPAIQALAARTLELAETVEQLQQEIDKLRQRI
jgi:prefoldin subunit 5